MSSLLDNLPEWARTRLVWKSLWFLTAVALLAVTLSAYGITWDEPIYQHAAVEIKTWLGLPFSGMLDPKQIDQHWRCDPLRNIHPSGLKWIYLAAQTAIPWEPDPFVQNRLLTILLVTAALILFFHWVFPGQPIQIGISIGLLFLMPRFFAHCHFAATDLPMIGCLLVLACCLDRFFDSRLFWVSALPLAFLACVKFTGLLLALPLLAITVLHARRGWKTVLFHSLVILAASSLLFWLLNPDWWFSPLSRAAEFIQSTALRKDWTPFYVFFAGKLYLYRGPFYSPAVILLITTPLAHLFLGAAGIVSAWRQRLFLTDRKWQMILAGTITPILLLMLPISPTNDMERYLLPAFPFAVCFVALGLRSALRFAPPDKLSLNLESGKKAFVFTCLVLLIGWNIGESVTFHPFELSYFNATVGGLPGAAKKGFEVNYWWEVLNDDALGQINEHCRGRRVFFPISPTDHFFRQMIELRKISFIPAASLQQADFILFYARPNIPFWEAAVLPRLRALGGQSQPVWALEKQGVTLLRLDACRRRDLFMSAPP
jgi:hypothetical protein